MQNIFNMGDNAINSSDFHDLQLSIIHARTNKILLDSLSTYYNFEDKMIFSTSILRKYENILRTELLDYTMKKEHFYRPEYVSYEIYGTTDLWYLLLFLNDMTKPDQFNQINIKALSPSYVETLNDIIEKERDNIHNINEPIKIKRELIKSLTSPSDQILSSSYDAKIKPMKLPRP